MTVKFVIKRSAERNMHPQLNLARSKRTRHGKWGILVCIIAVAIFVVVFSKYGVAEQMALRTEAENSLREARSALDAALAKSANYDAVLAEYNRYTLTSLSEAELSEADRTEVLTLVESMVVGEEDMCIRSVSVSGNTLQMSIAGLSLERISELTGMLEESKTVESVYVSSVNSSAGRTSALVTVTLAERKGAEQ